MKKLFTLMIFSTLLVSTHLFAHPFGVEITCKTDIPEKDYPFEWQAKKNKVSQNRESIKWQYAGKENPDQFTDVDVSCEINKVEGECMKLELLNQTGLGRNFNWDSGYFTVKSRSHLTIKFQTGTIERKDANITFICNK